jgi:hypothetical protein
MALFCIFPPQNELDTIQVETEFKDSMISELEETLRTEVSKITNLEKNNQVSHCYMLLYRCSQGSTVNSQSIVLCSQDSTVNSQSIILCSKTIDCELTVLSWEHKTIDCELTVLSWEHKTIDCELTVLSWEHKTIEIYTVKSNIEHIHFFLFF